MLPRFYDVVMDAAGNVLPGAGVVVTDYKGNAVTLYSDRMGATAISNVLTATSRGEIIFYAPSGHYILTTTAAGRPPDIREVSLGTGTIFNAEYFGIFPGTTGEITRGLQAWIDEIVGADHNAFPSGIVPSGVIELPWMNATCDSVIVHPSVSIIGDHRGGTQLTMKTGATPVNVGGTPQNQPSMFYWVARAYSNQGATAWMPELRNMRLIGAAGLQSNVPQNAVVYERTDNDNSPGGGYSAIGYSAGLIYNVDCYNFTQHGVWVQRGRQRFTLGGRARATNMGMWNSTDGLVVLGNGYRIEGDQPVMTDFGAGNCTGHAVNLNAVSGSLINGANVWGAESGARSNNAMAMSIFQSNGFSVTNSVFNDTVVIDGSNELDRASEFSGNYMKPNDVVFLSDGVPQGTADEQHNCHILVRTSLNINIGANGYGSGGSTGYRYLDILHAAHGAHVYASFSSSSFYDTVNSIFPCAWSSGRAVPINVYDTNLGTAVYYDFTDVNSGVNYTNYAAGGVEGANQNFVVTTTAPNPLIVPPAAQDTFLKFTGTTDVLNIQLPYPPAPGVVYTFTSVNQCTQVNCVLSSQAVTDGQTIVNQPGCLPAGESFGMIYRSSVKQWWTA